MVSSEGDGIFSVPDSKGLPMPFLAHDEVPLEQFAVRMNREDEFTDIRAITEVSDLRELIDADHYFPFEVFTDGRVVGTEETEVPTLVFAEEPPPTYVAWYSRNKGATPPGIIGTSDGSPFSHHLQASLSPAELERVFNRTPDNTVNVIFDFYRSQMAQRANPGITPFPPQG